MSRDDEDDYFNEDFDLVDEEDTLADEESDVAKGEEPEKSSDDDVRESRHAKRNSPRRDEESDLGTTSDSAEDEDLDEFGRPKPVANYVVHVYEYKKYKRTIERAFTPEEAEAFATEYNRTSKLYHRFAVTGKNDAKPKKSLDE